MKYIKTHTKPAPKANKTLIILMVVLIAIISIITPLKSFTVYAASKESTVEISKDLNKSIIDELEQIDFSGFNETIKEFEQNKTTNIFSIENIKAKVYSIISGENAVNYNSFFASIFSIFIDLVLKYLPMLSVIIAIGVISNLLSGIKSRFNEKSTSHLIHLVCFMAVVILVITMVTNLAKTAGKSIENMVGQMNALFPIMLTLMVSIGATASASVYQPIVAIISTYVADFFNFFIVRESY